MDLFEEILDRNSKIFRTRFDRLFLDGALFVDVDDGRSKGRPAFYI